MHRSARTGCPACRACWCWHRPANSRSRLQSRRSATAQGLRVRTVCLYGGAPYPVQNRALQRGVDLLVATPGRLMDHVERGRVDLSHLQVLVLDEADRMLDMGFIDDVERVCALTPVTRQTVLFSATFDGAMGRLAAKLTRDPVRVDVKGEKVLAGRHRAARALRRRSLPQVPPARPRARRCRHRPEHRLHRHQARRRSAGREAAGRRPRGRRAARRHEPVRAQPHAHGHAARRRPHAGRHRRGRTRPRRPRHHRTSSISICRDRRRTMSTASAGPGAREHPASPFRSRTMRTAARCGTSSASPARRSRCTPFPGSSPGRGRRDPPTRGGRRMASLRRAVAHSARPHRRATASLAARPNAGATPAS